MATDQQAVGVKPKGVAKGSTIIRWGRSEIQEVALEWIRICREKGIDPLKHPGMVNTALEAQKVLPENRRRGLHALTGKSNQRFIQAKIVELLAVEKMNNVPLTDTHKKKEAPTPIRIAPPAPKLEEKPEPKPDEQLGSGLQNNPDKFIPRHVEPELHTGLTFEELIVGFAEGVASIIVEESIKGLKKAFLRELPKLSMRAMSVSKTLPKLLVVGPLPKQQPQLEEAVAGVVELKFVSSEESPRLIQMRGNSCIGCLIWTNFVSHPHQDAAKKLFDSSNMRLVSGGLERVQTELENIAVQLPDVSV